MMASRSGHEKIKLPSPHSAHDANSGLFVRDETYLNLAPAFKGALLVIGQGLSVRAINQQAEPLLEYFFEKDTDLANFITKAFTANHIDHTKLHIPATEGENSFDLFALPMPETGELLILAHETTYQQNLITALMESRKLFKDLVACSSDFAWETNANGEFDFVSQKGALGYTADELVGHIARDILCKPDTGSIAFEAREAVDSQELWLRRFDGEEACVSISAVAKLNPQGVWSGARGVCRDITTLRKQERALEKARALEKLRLKIISAMRDLKAGKQMLVQMAQAITEDLPDSICKVARQKGGGLGFMDDPRNPLPKALTEVMADLEWQNFILDAAATQHPHTTVVEGRVVMFMLTEYRHTTNGVIFIIARNADDSLPEDAAGILVEATSHVGIAIDQINTHEDLERLSRTDELTGLLNRRAFMQDVGVRLKALKAKSSQSAALLYLDLDNLKAVNDQAGHGTGDFVIASFGQRLKAIAKNKNIAARVGGDEFLVWLDDTTQEETQEMARQLVAYCKGLGETARHVTPALGLSVGISMLEPSETLEISQLIHNADDALYKAKKSGKGTFIVMENQA